MKSGVCQVQRVLQTPKLQISRNELIWTWRISGGYMKADILRNSGN